jgi:hypothetical protein
VSDFAAHRRAAAAPCARRSAGTFCNMDEFATRNGCCSHSIANQGSIVMARRYSRGASRDVKSAMRRRKRGTLKRGKGGRGGKVKSRKQAIAIGLSEARKKGKKVPRKRASRRKK